MKKSTKIKIGVGVVVAASTATAVIASGKLAMFQIDAK